MTEQDKLFARGLAAGKSALQAATDAGFAKSTAHSRAYKWIGNSRNESEKPELFDYYQNLIRPTLEKQQFDIEEWVTRVSHIARGNPIDAIEDSGAFGFTFKSLDDIPDELRQSIKIISFKRGQGMHIEFYDKLKALEMLAKWLGAYITRTEVSGPNGGAIPIQSGIVNYDNLTDDELETHIRLLEKVKGTTD